MKAIDLFIECCWHRYSVFIVNFEHFRYINPFQANAPFLYPLKMSENFWISNFFQGL